MSTHVYGFTDPQSEDALHATRLLAVEERPFQRVTRRLLEKDSILRTKPSQLPSPPPEGEDAGATTTTTPSVADVFKRQKFREDVLLDFAALESSITRIQLIQNSNQRERERYAAEKAKILATANSVRENTLLLREQLVEAQRVLKLRKDYDAMAAKILDDRKLKSREESQTDISALQKEIEELQQENREFDGVWRVRREQFERVVAEGEVMKRVIKGIKEVPEEEGDKDETMQEDGEDEGGKEDRSRLGTPAVEEGVTPRFDTRDGTPALEGEEEPGLRNKFLDVEDATRSSSSPPASPAAQDVEMSENGAVSSAGALAAGQPKSSTGLEATDRQVVEPAEGGAPAEDTVETMDES